MRSFVLLVFAAFCLVRAQTMPTYVLYTASRQGEIEPCGCKVKQLGGLNRMSEKVSQLKKAGPVLFVDAGNAFFSAPQLNPERAASEKIRAELIAKSYQEMKLDFLAPGERDLALGPGVFFDLVKTAGAKVVSANLEVSEKPWSISAYEIWESNGFKIMVTGLSRFEIQAPEGFKIKPSMESLEKIISIAKKEHADRLIVLSHLGQDEDKKIAKTFPGLFVLGSSSMDLLSEPIRSEESYLFEPGIEGQRLGQIELKKESPGFVSATLVEMTEELNVANPVKLLMQSYYEKIKNDSKESSRANFEATKYVAQPMVCKGCHEEQFNFWKQTKHSSAILTLYAKNQHYNPSCVACHTLDSDKWLKNPKRRVSEKILSETFKGEGTGELDSRKDPERHLKLHRKYWQKVENRKSELEKNLMGVQCEHCHGNRTDHLQGVREKRQPVQTVTCQACHHPPNAPEFQQDMVTKVSCPRISR